MKSGSPCPLGRSVRLVSRRIEDSATLSWPCFLQAQRRSHFWELIEERENNPFDNDEEEVVTFELGEMLLMLLAAGGDDELTDSEDEWDLFHDELEDFYDLDL